MSDDLEQVMTRAVTGAVPEGDVKRQLKDKKDTVKTDVHNAMLWVLFFIAVLLALGLALCVLSYFCYIIRGAEVPVALSVFLGKSLEWILVSGASFFAALKVRDFCE